MLKKLFAALGALALVFGLVALVAGPASAHTHTVSASCAAGVSVNLNYYRADKPNANHLSVTLDGVIVDDEAFSGGVVKTFPWAAANGAHSYTVTVFAYDDVPPPGSLNGPSGYSFSQSGSVTSCELAVTPAVATPNDAVCTAPGTVGGGGYTIPTNSTGVSGYEAMVGNGAWAPTSAGFHPLTVGTTVNIRADAASGYKFTGTYTWTFTITGDNAVKCIVPTPPTPNYAVCTTPGNSSPASYVIPADSPAYHFTLVGSTTTLTAGSHPVTTFETVINIAIVLDNGSIVVGGTPGPWRFDFVSPGNCYGQSVPTGVTPQYTVCSATPGQSTDNGYTIPIDTGVVYQLKNAQGGWDELTPYFHRYLDGKTAGAVDIRAIATGPYTLKPGVAADFPFTFSAALDCLKTVVPAASSTPVTCDPAIGGAQLPGTYTLNAVTGVIYKVSEDGGSYAVTSAGTYKISAGHTINVIAVGDTANGYRIDGDPKAFPTFTFTSAGDCTIGVRAVEPNFVDGSCDVAHPGTIISGTYTVLQADHVSYTATVNGGKATTLTVGVANPAAPGDVVVITPVADAGYVISPVIAAELLKHTFAAVSNNCLVQTPVIKPAPTDQSCVVNGNGSGGGSGGGVQLPALSESPLSTSALGTRSLSGAVNATLTAAALPTAKTDVTHTLIDAFITIPSLVDSPHAIYYINDVVAAPGKHILPAGTYKVSAMPQDGYSFDPVADAGPWTEVLASAQPCGDLITHPLVEPSAVPVPMGCFTNGSYTLSNDLADPNALIWTVNGSVVGEGKYVVSTPSTITIHVATSGPSYGFEADAKTDYTFNFFRPSSCDLKTLALTGSTPVGWIALGYAMLVSGLALLAVRFTRRRGEQA